jgi:hypothetical protein
MWPPSPACRSRSSARLPLRLLANGVWRRNDKIAVSGKDPESGEAVLDDLEVIIMC